VKTTVVKAAVYLTQRLYNLQMQTQPAVVEQQVNCTPVVVWLTFTLLRVSMAMGSFPGKRRAGGCSSMQ